ncbi:MAG: hypothetical protein ACLS5E_00645 [[Ruminococcus] lactaris]
MDKQITRLTLDVGLRDSYKVVFAKMGDTERRVIAEIKDNGEEYSLTGVNTVEVRCRKADGKQVTKNATKENNTIVIDISGQMTTCKGTAIVDVVLYGTSGGVLSTAKFYLNVDDGAVSEDEIKSSNEYESLTDALRVVGLSKEVAETALTTANEALDTAGKLSREQQKRRNRRKQQTRQQQKPKNRHRQQIQQQRKERNRRQQQLQRQQKRRNRRQQRQKRQQRRIMQRQQQKNKQRQRTAQRQQRTKQEEKQ